MREANDGRSTARAFGRRYGIWPGGRPCIWFYDRTRLLPTWLCPLIIRLGGGAVTCLELHQVERGRICPQ
jgi:hypothetical protein